MAVDDRNREGWKQASMVRQRLRSQSSLSDGGGDGHPPSMDTEVALLKQRADQSDLRMVRVEDKLDRIADRLGTLATKDDIQDTKRTAWTALGTGGALAVAIVALFVGVLAYLQDQRIASRPDSPAPVAQAPIILQLPPWSSAPPLPGPTVAPN